MHAGGDCGIFLVSLVGVHRWQLWKQVEKRALISCYHYRRRLSIPAILGMKLACPDIPMVGYCGDGSFLMRIMELETLARTGVNVPIVVFNDQSLGTIRSRQKTASLAEYGLKLSPVDIPKVARGFGLNGVEVNNASDYELELKKAMAQDKTTIISVCMDHVYYRDLYPRLVGSLA